MKFKRTIWLLEILLLFALTGRAQVATVTFDYEKAIFDNFQPLPAEKPLLIKGEVPPGVDRIEIELYDNLNKTPLAIAIWKRPPGSGRDNFETTLNYRLQPSSRYGFRFRYFRVLPEADRRELFERAKASIDTYLEQAFELRGDNLRLLRSPRRVVGDLDELMILILEDYRPATGLNFDGFSPLVERRLKQLEKLDLDRGLQAAGKENRQTYARQVLSEVKQLIYDEIESLLSGEWTRLVDRRQVSDYPTQKRPGFFSLHAGYGGVYLGGNIKDLEYDDAPYLGFAFPLSTRKTSPAVLRNAALTVSVFLRDLEDDAGREVTGPVIDQPLGVGLDYKLFQFIYLHGGAALLERRQGENGSTRRQVLLQPFVGVHAKINLSLSLGD